MHFTFGSPVFLVLLLLLPCFFLCKQYAKTYYFPKLSWISRQSPFLSFEPWLKMFLFSLVVFALAKPFVFDSTSNKHKKGRDLILAVDASGSMAQSGFDTDNRMQTKYSTTLTLSQDFIKKRHDDNMGIVVFGTFAYTASPLTYDLASLSYLLGMTNVGLAGDSTALGDAITQSLKTLHFGEAKNKAIILLTDGYHNAGQTSPKKAVQEAVALGVKIYTIGIGKKSDYDTSLLETIAKKTGGKSYSASNTSQLSKVYEAINSLEPSPIRSENYLNKKLLISLPLSLAFVLLFLWTLWLYVKSYGEEK
jgi:Ca-activated chloride channel family protein